LPSFHPGFSSNSTLSSLDVSDHDISFSERIAFAGETSVTPNSVDPAKVEKSVVTVRIIDSVGEEGGFEAFFLAEGFLGDTESMRGVLTKRTKFMVIESSSSVSAEKFGTAKPAILSVLDAGLGKIGDPSHHIFWTEEYHFKSIP
jgi:hypothetical protein